MICQIKSDVPSLWVARQIRCLHYVKPNQIKTNTILKTELQRRVQFFWAITKYPKVKRPKEKLALKSLMIFFCLTQCCHVVIKYAVKTSSRITEEDKYETIFLINRRQSFVSIGFILFSSSLNELNIFSNDKIIRSLHTMTKWLLFQALTA